MIDQNVAGGQITVDDLKTSIREETTSRDTTHPFRHQILHSLGHAVCEFGEILGSQGLAYISSIFGEVEERRLLHSMFSQVGQ